MTSSLLVVVNSEYHSLDLKCPLKAHVGKAWSPKWCWEVVEPGGGGAYWKEIRSSGVCPWRGKSLPFSLGFLVHKVSGLLCHEHLL